jgi:hypothetical protein
VNGALMAVEAFVQCCAIAMAILQFCTIEIACAAEGMCRRLIRTIRGIVPT